MSVPYILALLLSALIYSMGNLDNKQKGKYIVRGNNKGCREK